jgi:hypothetical protein
VPTLQPLQTFAANVYSQFGEDGIIAEMLDRIEAHMPLSRWSCEFGAADGVWFSNTCNLIRTRDFRAVMIEADPKQASKLAKNHPGPEVITLIRKVGFEGADRLDAILDAHDVPHDLDVLSIDIDGYDYWVLDSMESPQAKIIVIEFNPTMPNAVEYLQPRNSAAQHGSSARSLTMLAATKGYELAAVTDVNLILLRSDLHDAVLGAGVATPLLEELRDDADHITYVFSGYDGTVVISRPRMLFPWHNFEAGSAHLQVIPKFWRSFPGNWPRRGLRHRTWKIGKRVLRKIAWWRSNRSAT